MPGHGTMHEMNSDLRREIMDALDRESASDPLRMKPEAIMVAAFICRRCYDLKFPGLADSSCDRGGGGGGGGGGSGDL